MVSLITGINGKGKSKVLLDQVNKEVKEILGNIVFLDTSTKHMYELNNRIRLINVSEYLITNSDTFIGFITGIISQDHDLQQIYIDNYIQIANITVNELEDSIGRLEEIGQKFGVDFYLAISTTNGDISDSLKDKLFAAL